MKKRTEEKNTRIQYSIWEEMKKRTEEKNRRIQRKREQQKLSLCVFITWFIRLIIDFKLGEIWIYFGREAHVCTHKLATRKWLESVLGKKVHIGKGKCSWVIKIRGLLEGDNKYTMSWPCNNPSSRVHLCHWSELDFLLHGLHTLYRIPPSACGSKLSSHSIALTAKITLQSIIKISQ